MLVLQQGVGAGSASNVRPGMSRRDRSASYLVGYAHAPKTR